VHKRSHCVPASLVMPHRELDSARLYPPWRSVSEPSHYGRSLPVRSVSGCSGSARARRAFGLHSFALRLLRLPLIGLRMFRPAAGRGPAPSVRSLSFACDLDPVPPESLPTNRPDADSPFRFALCDVLTGLSGSCGRMFVPGRQPPAPRLERCLPKLSEHRSVRTFAWPLDIRTDFHNVWWNGTTSAA